MHFTALYCTILHHTALLLHHTAPYCTILHFTAPYCTLLHHTAPYCTLLHFSKRAVSPPPQKSSEPASSNKLPPGCTLLHHTALYCTILHHTAPYCTILHFTAPYCTILHLTAPYCTFCYSTFYSKGFPSGLKSQCVKQFLTGRDGCRAPPRRRLGAAGKLQLEVQRATVTPSQA